MVPFKGEYLKKVNFILFNCRLFIYLTSSVICRWRAVPRR